MRLLSAISAVKAPVTADAAEVCKKMVIAQYILAVQVGTPPNLLPAYEAAIDSGLSNQCLTTEFEIRVVKVKEGFVVTIKNNSGLPTLKQDAMDSVPALIVHLDKQFKINSLTARPVRSRSLLSRNQSRAALVLLGLLA
jgi:hypothetical protein